MRICISSGHGKHVAGASGVIDEVEEARRVVDYLAQELERRGAAVFVFHDNSSTSQGANLNAIVNAHNAQERELDVSVHFNAYVETTKPMGVEVLYLTQSTLAQMLSSAIADAGDFINRGAKKRTDLKFLNATEEPAVLLEICFVDSEADCELYEENFEAICDSIADVLVGDVPEESLPPPDPEVPETAPADIPRVDINISSSDSEVLVFVNGVQVGTKG